MTSGLRVNSICRSLHACCCYFGADTLNLDKLLRDFFATFGVLGLAITAFSGLSTLVALSERFIWLVQNWFFLSEIIWGWVPDVLPDFRKTVLLSLNFLVFAILLCFSVFFETRKIAQKQFFSVYASDPRGPRVFATATLTFGVFAFFVGLAAVFSEATRMVSAATVAFSAILSITMGRAIIYHLLKPRKPRVSHPDVARGLKSEDKEEYEHAVLVVLSESMRFVTETRRRKNFISGTINLMLKYRQIQVYVCIAALFAFNELDKLLS